jgi:hypothetical protein
MARPRSALSTFILSLPSGLSVKEVIEKAKAKGLKASESNVYRVRRLMGGKTAKKTPTKQSAPSAKPTTLASSTPLQSKAEFVRGLSHLAPKQIIEKAKAAGLKLDVSYVYNVRGKTKTSSKKRGRPPVTTSTNGAAAPSANHDSSTEVTFRRLVLTLGFGRAKSLLGEFETKLSALIAGR